jgi:hypothetical protein
MKKSIVLLLTVLSIGLHVKAQERVTLAVKDLNKDIEKYIRNHYENHATVEAYKYNTVFLMGVTKADSTIELIFDHNGKFIYTRPADFNDKVSLQSKTTMSIGDVDRHISKFIKKNYEGFDLNKAIRYDIVYLARVAKVEEKIWLLFDKNGGFIDTLDDK